MIKEIEQIIKENFDVWYNRENNSIELNSLAIAEKLEDYFKDEGFEELINTVEYKEIYEKANGAFEYQDFDALKEKLSGRELDLSIYSSGYVQGYLQSYEDTTGLDFPL